MTPAFNVKMTLLGELPHYPAPDGLAALNDFDLVPLSLLVIMKVGKDRPHIWLHHIITGSSYGLQEVYESTLKTVSSLLST
jgi:hypothetical protein